MSPEEQEPAEAWHAMPFEEVLRALGSSPRGLAVQDAARRLAIDGPNALPDPVRVPLLRTMLRQLRSPLAGILLAAAALSLVMGSHADAAFIAAVLLVNATIGGVQEWRAECGAHALRRMLRAHATVVRGGEAVEIDAREIVRGDLILLEPGASVPADGRLASAEGLEVDESLLTGESAPAAKDACAEAGPRTQPLADRASMVHAGTTVSRGRATAVVVATAGRTALGTLARDVERASRGKPPLVLRLERFTRVVGTACVVAAAAVALIGWLAQGHPPAHMAVFAVALAVSIVPEGLPVAITIALSIASRRMSRRGVIVRRLDAVEGLGSCTMILSDKTGTLTCNELTVREVRLPSRRRLEMSGQGFVPEGDLVPPRDGLDAEDRERLVRLVDGMVLCNEASLGNDGGSWRWRGDPTDIALLCFARKLGVSRDALLAERPESRRTCFEPEQRFASSVHDLHGTPWIHAKGAPERIDAMCAANARPDLAAAREMAAAGLRVLAVADGPAERCGSEGAPRGLSCAGLVGMIDPLRADARDAVRRCRDAGVRIAMVTGDHQATALAIARDLSLGPPRGADGSVGALTGEMLDRIDDTALERAVSRDGIHVFARVSPAQKLRLVEAARRAGELVAVTGDGANDAPALKAANIGVAMGKSGTDAARESADLVIADDRLSTIVDGIEEGRVAYANIRKVVHLLVSTNCAEAILVIGAISLGLPLPLLPTQLLWLNLATEGLQDVALAFEPAERGVLAQPPRPARQAIFDRLMIERLLVGSIVIGGTSLWYFAWLIGQGVAEDDARNRLLLLMVLFENAQAGNSRSETRSVFASWPWTNPALLVAVAAGLALHVGAMHLPALRGVLATSPVSLGTFASCALLSLAALAAVELHKLAWSRRRRLVSRADHAPAA